MKVLAYDTSGPRLSVALQANGKILGESVSEAGVRHSDVLMPMIEALLKECRTKMDTIDVLAVGLGPGSFTGLRVGIATAKVLGYVLKKKIVGVSSLEAAAHAAMRGTQGRAAVLKDARRSRVYGAVYEMGKHGMKTLFSPSLLLQQEFLDKAQGAVLVRADEAPSGASEVAAAALSKISRKKFIDPFKLEPLYLHARDCNVTHPKK